MPMLDILAQRTLRSSILILTGALAIPALTAALPAVPLTVIPAAAPSQQTSLAVDAAAKETRAQETGTIKLKASFDNKDNVLFPNQFVNVRLLLNSSGGPQ